MDMLHEPDIYMASPKRSRHFFIYIWIMYAMVYMTRNCFSSAMAQIVAQGVFTKSQTGLITATFYAVYAPLQVPGGILADKYNPERLVQIGLLSAATANMIIFFNHNYYVILVVWVLGAIVQAPLWPSVFKIISSQMSKTERPKMVFLISFGTTFGLLVGYVIAAFIPSWEYNFAVSAVVLIILAVLMYELCIHYGEYVKRPDGGHQTKTVQENNSNVSTLGLFARSGFLFLLPSVFFRNAIENGAKTLSPTMLMECYENVSSSIGNLLNIFIIVAGLAGLVVAKVLIYPRLIKNEVGGICFMLIACMPFLAALKLVGIIPVGGAVISLCGVTFTTTITHMFMMYFFTYFSQYGKNATAAGLVNSLASIGVVASSYGMTRVAELFGWNAVTTLWIIMMAIAIAFSVVAIPLATRFKNSLSKQV